MTLRVLIGSAKRLLKDEAKALEGEIGQQLLSIKNDRTPVHVPKYLST